MDAAAHGATDFDGISVGILPGPDRLHSSRWLTISIPTDMGHARNAIVALAADAIIAVSGGYGTLSEIALGMKMGKPVIGLETWELGGRGGEIRIVPALTPKEAVELAVKLGSIPPRVSPGLDNA